MKILFVCTGNTCRSCMAEAIFNQTCTLNNITALSAGIAVYPNSSASKNAVHMIKENFNLDISQRRAVQLTPEIIKDSDLVLTMTSYIRDVLINHFPEYKDKIYALNEYIGVKEEVSDPYGGDVSIYKKSFDMLKDYILLLLDKLKEDKVSY